MIYLLLDVGLDQVALVSVHIAMNIMTSTIHRSEVESSIIRGHAAPSETNNNNNNNNAILPSFIAQTIQRSSVVTLARVGWSVPSAVGPGRMVDLANSNVY